MVETSTSLNVAWVGCTVRSMPCVVERAAHRGLVGAAEHHASAASSAALAA
jgi:hypothetical protein